MSSAFRDKEAVQESLASLLSSRDVIRKRSPRKDDYFSQKSSADIISVMQVSTEGARFQPDQMMGFCQSIINRVHNITHICHARPHVLCISDRRAGGWQR
jgi:hypothetical protein